MTKKKATAKKSTAKKATEPTDTSINLVQYGYAAAVNNLLKAMENTWRGETIPADPEKRADFWKKYLDREVQEVALLKREVNVLKDLVIKQMQYGGRCDC